MAWYDEKAMDLLTNDFNDLFVVFREVTPVHQSIPQFTDFADFCGDRDPIVIFEDAGKWEGVWQLALLPTGDVERDSDSVGEAKSGVPASLPIHRPAP